MRSLGHGATLAFSRRRDKSPVRTAHSNPIGASAPPAAVAASLTSAAMKIEKDRVVLFHYSVAENHASGQERESLESSQGNAPLAILFGRGNIIPGLENAMAGHEAGDRFEVDVAAVDAYGEKRDGLSQRVPKKHFGGQRLEPGMQVVLNTNFGQRAVTIQKVGMSVVDVDLNHPMAGKDLHFDIEVTAVREATPEELEHGHVHGDGGHQH
jgi:FKBP-type peptidyl-prolyl cis-trans isomerase SlyD